MILFLVRFIQRIQTRHQLRNLARYMAVIFAICAVPLAVDSKNLQSRLSTAAEKEITSVTAEIDRVEAGTLSQIQKGSLDSSQRIILLGKVIFFDQNLSVQRNESCAFCHMPETGFSGPISALNQTTAAYPGSIRTRFSARTPQGHTYANFSPVLHYNPRQDDFVGGAFWDMRATGLRLNSPLAEQAQGPPVNPNEMGLIDPAYMVYRVAGRPAGRSQNRCGVFRHLRLPGPQTRTLCAIGRVPLRLPIHFRCTSRLWIAESRKPPSTG